MAGLWSLILSETSINLVKNPVFGNGTTDWGTTNGTLATNTTASNLLFGTTAGYYSGAALPANSGAQTALDGVASATIGYVSAWVKGTVPAKFGVFDGVWVYSSGVTTLETGPNGYTRYGASFSAADMSGVTQVGCFFAGTVAAYLGGVQCEQSSTYTTQITGELGPGYVWNGTEHASSSTRYVLDEAGRTVWGGSIVDVDDRVNVVCEGTVGAGLLPLEVEKVALAGEVKNLFVGQGLQPRDIQLALVVNAATFAEAHTRRATLLAKLAYGREVWVRYNGANSPLEVKAAAAGSFDMDLGRSRMGRRAVLQFTALDPRFRLIGPERTTLTLSAAPSSSAARRRTDKDGWGAMDSGLFAAPRRAIQGPDGTVYIGTGASGGTAKVQKWTGTTWTEVASFTGSITAGPTITDLVIVNNSAVTNGLYVFGDFTAVNGNSSVGWAFINLTTGAVSALVAAAVGGIPRCALFEPVYNRLFIAGDFASWAGVANSSYVMYYDYNAPGYVSLGSARPSAAVYCMVADAQGNVVLGGDFTNTFPLANMSATTATLATGGANANTAQWNYRVVARDSAGGLTTGVDSATLTGTTTQGSATISWSAVAGAAGYRLYVYENSYSRRTSNVGSYWSAVVDLPANILSYYDDGTAYLAALREAEHTPPTGNTTGDYGARIVKFVGRDGTWERMAQRAGGFNGIVRCLALAGHGGTLVAGGSFTQADGATANRVAYTRGKRWLPLGASGMGSGQVNRVAYDRGRVWAVGSFTSADGDSLAALMARLDGFPTGGWTHTDAALANSSNQAYDILVSPHRVMVFDDTTYSSAAAGTSIAYTGTANLYPRFVVMGPGTLRSIRNGLTGARISLAYAVQTGERVVIDCEARRVTSTLRGDITYLVHPSSQLDAFYLAANQTQTIWVHMTGTTGASRVALEGYRALLTADV